MNEGDYSDSFAFKDFACIVVEVCLRLKKVYDKTCISIC